MNNKKIIIISSIVAVIIGIILIFVLTNKPTYNIKFDTNGGNLIEEQLVKKGDKVIQPHDPIKDGYAFAEWTYEGTTYDFSQEVTSNLTLVAKWIKIETNTEKIIVKFNTDGGSTISNQILEKGDFVIKPADPTKKGYKFAGWLLNEKPYDFKTPVDEKIELKAKWEKVEEETKKPNNSSNNNTTTNNNKPATTPTKKTYKLTYDANGGSVSPASKTLNEGDKYGSLPTPNRSGYSFEGWYTSVSDGKKVDEKTIINGNVTIYAHWNKNKTYKCPNGYTLEGTKCISKVKITRSCESGYTLAEEGSKAGWQCFKTVETGVCRDFKWHGNTYYSNGGAPILYDGEKYCVYGAIWHVNNKSECDAKEDPDADFVYRGGILCELATKGNYTFGCAEGYTRYVAGYFGWNIQDTPVCAKTLPDIRTCPPGYSTSDSYVCEKTIDATLE